MSSSLSLRPVTAQPRAPSAHAGLLLQRKCTCGATGASLSGQCDECRNGKRHFSPPELTRGDGKKK
jgi:hypothetical protein